MSSGSSYVTLLNWNTGVLFRMVSRKRVGLMGKKARFTLKVIKAWVHFVKSVTFLGWKSENFLSHIGWWFKQIFAGQLFVHSSPLCHYGIVRLPEELSEQHTNSIPRRMKDRIMQNIRRVLTLQNWQNGSKVTTIHLDCLPANSYIASPPASPPHLSE